MQSDGVGRWRFGRSAVSGRWRLAVRAVGRSALGGHCSEGVRAVGTRGAVGERGRERRRAPTPSPVGGWSQCFAPSGALAFSIPRSVRSLVRSGVRWGAPSCSPLRVRPLSPRCASGVRSVAWGCARACAPLPLALPPFALPRSVCLGSYCPPPLRPLPLPILPREWGTLLRTRPPPTRVLGSGTHSCALPPPSIHLVPLGVVASAVAMSA